MEFGDVDLNEAQGAILAHSQPVARGRIRKGRILDGEDLARLRAEGIERVTVARPAAGDLAEDAAAAALARALVPDPAAADLRVTEASTGRVNFYATAPGIVDLDAGRLHALNRLDPMVTVATLPPYSRTRAGLMVATVKIIAYAVPAAVVETGARLAYDALRVAPVVLRDATLIVTDMGQSRPTGEAAIATRLDRLGIALSHVRTAAHTCDAIADALRQVRTDLCLLMTASATSDARDVGPEGLRAAGGTLTRFGMPVDPGNLLFYGRMGARHVIGLPGCARSPALNGADWVLERIACGRTPTDDEIAAMGVGGLLKESPARPHPRDG